MNSSTIVGVVLAVLVVGGLGWYFTAGKAPTPQAGTVINNNQGSNDPTPTPTSGTNGSGVNAGVNVNVGAPTTAQVVLGANGFSPATVTVKKGGTVTWTNEGTGRMWVGVDEHPTHTQYNSTTRTAHCPDTAGVAFDQCTTGNTYSFTFNKVGEWEYHNHVSAAQTGKVIVVE